MLMIWLNRDDEYECCTYAACRSSLLEHIFVTTMAYHETLQGVCVDLDCGKGAGARDLASHFRLISGVDTITT